MKKYLFLCLVGCLSLTFLTSCEKDDGDEMEDYAAESSSNFTLGDSIVTEYPAAIDEYVTQNYPNAAIMEVALKDDGTYEVELDSGIELIFDATGTFLEEDIEEGEDDNEGEDDDDEYVTEYPTAIDDYIAQNYPDAMIESVELEDDGTYEVELDSGIELIFDADGNFLEEDNG